MRLLHGLFGPLLQGQGFGGEPRREVVVTLDGGEVGGGVDAHGPLRTVGTEAPHPVAGLADDAADQVVREHPARSDLVPVDHLDDALPCLAVQLRLGWASSPDL